MLLGIVAPSMAFADPNNNHNNSNTVAPAAPTNAPEGAATVDQQQQPTQQTKAKSKTVTKPREKSMLDSQSDNSPINYLRKAFSSDDDSTSGLPSGTSGTVTQAVKLLVAAALSTIM